MSISCFSPPLWFPKENRIKLKKILSLNGRLKWRAQYPRYVEHTYYFLISNSSNTIHFWTEDNFCCISDCCSSLFDCKLKKLINEQIVIFFSPSNAPCSYDEFIETKHVKHNTAIGMHFFFTWFNQQILIFC